MENRSIDGGGKMQEEKIRIAIPASESGTENYREVLRLLGAEPVLVGETCEAGQFDGLLLPGGGDVEASRFGQEDCGSNPPDLALDALQFAVLDRFVKAGKPVLGICRGHQVINIYFGGDLIQDLGDEKNGTHKFETADKVHQTCTAADSWLGRLYGTKFAVNSSHHQGNDRIGAGLRAVSEAEDGVNEALEHEQLPIISVQWHPERMCFSRSRTDTVDGRKVWEYFLSLCRDQKELALVLPSHT